MLLQAIRAMCDTLGHTHIVTLYQAGNHIFELFDKVLVLDHGKQIYYGPARGAKAFMEHLGFMYTPGANVADFLTSVTVPTERRIRDGRVIFPRTAAEIRMRYNATTIKSDMVKEYDFPYSRAAQIFTDTFREERERDKHRHVPKNSPLMIGFTRQVNAAVIRQFQLLRGDWISFLVTQASGVRSIDETYFHNLQTDDTMS